MQYLGGKQRIAKPLSEFLNSQLTEGQTFVDLFCGSCNVVSNIRQDVKRYANDKNKYLPVFWGQLQLGWLPPTVVTREQHAEWKKKEVVSEIEIATKCFIGYGCSFSGDFFRGYATNKRGYDFCRSAYNSSIRKANKMKDVEFFSMDYSDFICPEGSLVYCDIPYRGNNSVFCCWCI